MVHQLRLGDLSRNKCTIGQRREPISGVDHGFILISRSAAWLIAGITKVECLDASTAWGMRWSQGGVPSSAVWEGLVIFSATDPQDQSYECAAVGSKKWHEHTDCSRCSTVSANKRPSGPETLYLMACVGPLILKP